ncbi:MAG: hypothetical protein Q7T16_03385 [Candidatus Burarchaeum sp.]|nr:hypothetical protein [Candidatus Burarchaeum sp.]MDO8339675.1 hypothetical protein [Candidatus Burarchaeum sp.]
MKRNFAVVLLTVLAAIALAGCLTSAPAPPTVGNVDPVDVGNWWGDWVGICIFALFLSMLVVALAYMYGSAVRSPETLAWCKVEIYQIAMTALVVAGLVSIVWTIAAIDTSVIGMQCTLPAPSAQPGEPAATQLDSAGAGCNMFDLSIVYLKWIRQQTWITYQRFLLIYQKYAFQTSITYGAALGGIGPQMSPMAWLQPVISYLTLQLNFIAPALVTIIALIEIMRYVQFGMLNIILPVGVVCRCFGPLRNFGGSLMGMAIALFLFFPFMFALNAAVLMPAMVDASGQPTQYALDEIAFENQLTTVSTNIKELDYLELDKKMKSGILPNTGTPSNPIYDPASPALSPEQTMTNWADGTWYQISVMLDGLTLGNTFNTSHIILGALVLPILDFLIIIIAAKDLSRMLGEEIDVTNLTRMI